MPNAVPPVLIDRPPQGFVECEATGLWVHHSDMVEHCKTCQPCTARTESTTGDTE